MFVEALGWLGAGSTQTRSSPGSAGPTLFWQEASLHAPPQEAKLAAWPRGTGIHAGTIHPNFQMRSRYSGLRNRPPGLKP